MRDPSSVVGSIGIVIALALADCGRGGAAPEEPPRGGNKAVPPSPAALPPRPVSRSEPSPGPAPPHAGPAGGGGCESSVERASPGHVAMKRLATFEWFSADAATLSR